MTTDTEQLIYAEISAQWNLIRVRPWRVALPLDIDWDDLRQIVTIRAWSKAHLWNASKGPRTKWLGRVMTLCLMGLLTRYRSDRKRRKSPRPLDKAR